MRKIILAAAAAISFAGPAGAALFTNDFGALVTGYGPNDDSTFSASVPFTYSYFGTAYDSVTVSNNGNVQFGSNSGAFSPDPLNTSTAIRAIAPYWTDLDSRSDPLGGIAAGTGGSGVYVSTPTANQIIFTWDRLGYYSRDYSGRVLFQLVLNNPNAPIAAGQAEIGFYYGAMQPQPGRAVQIGFGDGSSAVNPGEIALFGGLTTDVTSALGSGAGQYLFNVQDGVIVEQPTGVPEPATVALLGLGLFGLGAARRRRG